MGLAAPRKRTKIANDPRNLAWTSSAESYGQRLMQSQGWQSGDALGARGRGVRYADTDAAKVTVRVKDDTLGLGASLKSKDLAHQRTGFDAFQGLLGRLNAKDEAELKAVEKKIEDKKLASWAQGRWGGMVFVPGGILVQSDPFKQKIEAEREKAAEMATLDSAVTDKSSSVEATEMTEKEKLKMEKKQRKEQRRRRKELKLLKKSGQNVDESSLPTPESSSSGEAESSEKEKSKKRPRSTEAEQIQVPIIVVQAKPATGRHILRGKNILAKRAAFADMKGLDEIFMKKG